MKSIAVALAVAGSASAFAPSFMGQKLIAPASTTSSSTPTMLLNFGGSKKAAQKASPPGVKPPSPSQFKGAVKKTPQQAKQAGQKVQQQAKQAGQKAQQAAKKVQQKAPTQFKSAPSQFKSATNQVQQKATQFKSATSQVQQKAKQTTSQVKKTVSSSIPSAPRKAPAPRQVSSPGFAGGLVGSDVETPFFDPWGLSAERSPEGLAWFRASELKHGRICMLAALGLLVQSVYHLPDDVFSNPKGIDALYQVASERPQAIAQILLAIGAVEVASLLAVEDKEPGDLGFDPLNLKPKTSEGLTELQLKEIKNGRLAMVGVAGMLVQETLTKQGVLEQINSGHISPFGDGQGYF